MAKTTKLLTLIVALSLVALPGTASATYDSLYANAADPIFSGSLWTGMDTGVVDDAAYSYHVWYDNAVTDERVDYYIAYYDTYTTEWLTYTDSTVGAERYESWSYSTNTAGTYEAAMEMVDYNGTAWYNIDYSLYDDGSNSYYEYYQESATGNYYYEYDQYASGSWYYEEYSNSYTDGGDWYVEKDYNLSEDYYYEEADLYNPAGGTESDSWYRESLSTGSYQLYQEEYTGKATYLGGGDWSWEYDSYTELSESYSADYSSFDMEYDAYTYDAAHPYDPNTYYYEYATSYYEWDYSISDSGYYDKGYQWDDEVSGYYEESSEGLYQDDGTDWSYQYFEADKWDPATGKDQWRYEYDYEENPYTGEFYEDTYTETWDATTHTYLDEYSYYDPYDGWTGDGYYYSADETSGTDWYYQEYVENYSGDNGNSGYEARQYSSTSGAPGYDYYESSYYDSSIQENSFYQYYNAWSATHTTENYSYYESSLEDSDQKYVSWSDSTYDGTTGAQLTYESYYYNLNSDYRTENWSYSYYDYAPANDTYYSESHWTNLASGAYEDSEYYWVSGQSEQGSSKSQDLDYYEESSYKYDYVAGTYQSTDYEYVLANGNQYWESYSSNSTGWSDLELYYLTDHWEGAGLDYINATSTYVAKLYANYPEGYFPVTRDQLYQLGYDF